MTVGTALRRLETDLGDLIAKHEKARDLSEFTRYEDDPVGFIRDVLKGDPWEAQVAIAESVRDNPLVVVRSCNAAGKDWVAAHLALWFVYARRGLVLITGPTQRQVREVALGEVGRAWGRAQDLPGELYANALRLGRSEQAGILAFTSTDASRLTGFHAPRLMVILTEAQGVESFAWEAALACATGEGDKLLAVGNPLSPAGRFYEACRSPNWVSHRISAFDCPNVVQGREVVPGAITAAGVERIESEYGRGSGIYKARVLGEFPDESIYGLVRRAWLEEAARKHASGESAEEASRNQPVCAIDPARYGPDHTALAVRRGPVLHEIVTWAKLDTQESAERVVMEAGRFGIHPRGRKWTARGKLVTDAVGLGSGVHDTLKRLGYAAIPFNGGSSPRRPDRFLNLRAEAYWGLRKLLEDGKVALAEDELLWDELTATEWSVTAEGKVRIKPKDDLRNRLGRSPDRADAVSMAFSQVAFRRSGTFLFEL